MCKSFLWIPLIHFLLEQVCLNNNVLDMGKIAPYFWLAMVAVVAATFKTTKSIIMKKLTAVIAALAIFLSASAFSPTPGGYEIFNNRFNLKNAKSVKAENISKNVSRAFSLKFADAKLVNWNEYENFYFAEFVMNEKTFKVGYSDQGELLAVSRSLSIDLLPLAVTDALSQNYKDYKIPTNVTEIVMQGSTSYYLTVEGKTRFLVLNCSPDGSISIEKRIKKKILVGSVS